MVDWRSRTGFAAMRSVIMLAIVALAAAVIVPRYVMGTNAAHPLPAAMAARPVEPLAPAAADSRSVIVPRDARGHFQIDGRVDGRRLTFMVDTGASVVALTASDAASLGIHPAERDFTVLVKTANGTVRAAPVELNRVEIADLTVHNVAAMVLPEGALSDNLLGLSFLSRLRRFEYSQGKLVLEQ
jgi:aspartyl protease family protein